MELYLSYAWNDPASPDVNFIQHLQRCIAAKGWTLRMDTNSVNYRDSVRAFMAAMGAGQHIIAVVSHQYLHSPYCMYEVKEMLKYPQWKQRVYPIVLDDADIFRGNGLEYTQHWQEKLETHSTKVEALGNNYSSIPWLEQKKDLQDILDASGNFLRWLAEVCQLKAREHLDTGFRDLLALLEKEQQNHQIQHPSKIAIKSAVQQVPLIRNLPQKKKVDCDRYNEYTQSLLDDFLGQLEGKNLNRNLYYFICGCTSQKPESIAKRLVYEHNESFTELKYEEDEIRIFPLEIALTPAGTWIYFWKIFTQHFDKSFPDLNGFITEADTQLYLHKRIPVFCKVKQNSWTSAPKLENHIKFIIDKLSTLPFDYQKFVVFFIFEFKGLHEKTPVQKGITKHWEKLKSVRFNSKAENERPHIKLILLKNRVAEYYVKSWLSDILNEDEMKYKTKEDYVALLLSSLINELDTEELVIQQTERMYNMSRVEVLQGLIHSHSNTYKE